MKPTLEERIEDAFIADSVMKWGKALRDVCESPIEQLMFAFLVSAMDLAPSFSDEWATERFGRGNFHLTGVTWPKSRLALLQQVKVHGYRLDFAIVSTEDPAAPRVAIECDGHDYHERTKEQAAADKRRDRELTSRGWVVIRYTGSEIWDDPIGCATTAVDTAKRVIEGRAVEETEAAE